jgi:hypothetical protein
MTNIVAGKVEFCDSKKVLDILYNENLGHVLVGNYVRFDVIVKYGNSLLNSVPMKIKLSVANSHIKVSIDPFTNEGRTVACVVLDSDASGCSNIIPYVDINYLQENGYGYVRKNYGECVSLIDYAVATKQVYTTMLDRYRDRDKQGMLELIDKIEKDLDRLRCLATGT